MLFCRAPTSGGQYHWVSEWSPPSCQRFLSYIVGWLCFTGWQAAICSITFLCGTIIQGLIALNNEKYALEGQRPWHGTLLVIAVTAFAIFFNTALAKKLPLVEGLLLVLHVVGFFAIIIGESIKILQRSAFNVHPLTPFQSSGSSPPQPQPTRSSPPSPTAAAGTAPAQPSWSDCSPQSSH